MSLKDLVQVDDDAWIEPSDVLLVKHWPPRPEILNKGEMTRDKTVIKHRDGHYTVSYWPFDRIQRVLGLIDRTWLHDFWEGT